MTRFFSKSSEASFVMKEEFIKFAETKKNNQETISIPKL